MVYLEVTTAQSDAILAGLRLLQRSLNKDKGCLPVEPDDGDLGDILTNAGDHGGLDVAEIDDLCEEINGALDIA